MPDEAQDLVLEDHSNGGRLVTADGRTLPLRGVTLTADARGGLVRAVLDQRFVNPYAEALRVSYLVPLPVDGALAGYAIRIGDRRIVGEVDRIQAARERFETALLEGQTAGLVDQERPNLFTLELGNVPSGVEVVAELTIDQRLAWLGDGAWEWRFPTVVAPRYLGGDGRVTDADRVMVDVTAGPVSLRATVTLLVRDALAEGRTPGSPSHPVAVVTGPSGHEMTIDSMALDRDVVIRWRVAGSGTGLALDTARPAEGHTRAAAGYGLLTLVPPAPDARAGVMPRDLIVLIDTSGSMAGQPLVQAKTVIRALVQSLGDTDQLEMIAFSSEPRRWRRGAERVTEPVRKDALAWLEGLTANGSTEMREALTRALRPLRRDAQRQTVLVTDGLIGFEGEIIAAVAQDLPAGSRLHTVGVGSGVNRALTASAARAGRGVEVVLGLDEAVTPHVARLLATTQVPVLTDITLTGAALRGHAPAALPDVYAGAPLLAALELSPDGGDLIVQGRTAAGAWEGRLTVPALAPGHGRAAVISLYGRETVEDREVQRAIGNEAVDAEIERLGLEYQIATRLTSWVAIVEEPSVDPTKPTRRERMPHALPYGMSIDGLGLRPQTFEVGSFAGTARLQALLGLKDASRSFSGSGMEARLSLGASERSVFLRPTRLTARLVLRTGRELTFEIAVDTAFDWDPDGVVLMWPGGTHLKAQIVEPHTTARGTVEAGVTVRLSIRLDQDGPDGPPRHLLLRGPHDAIRIPVRRA